MSRCLVTGATGFVGSHVARALVERGDAVRVTVRAGSPSEPLEGVDAERVNLPDVTDRRANDLLELFALHSHRHSPISAYSKGMKQRVLISAALLHDPDLLIFDEPESGLDVTATLVLRHLVKTLAARGQAILYSSHILEVVEKVCTRVIVLHRGRVVADDGVERFGELVANRSLEGVFRQLVLRVNPEETANEIADVVTSRG